MNPEIKPIGQFNFQILNNYQGKAYEIIQIWQQCIPFQFIELDNLQSNQIHQFLPDKNNHGYYRLFNNDFDLCIDQDIVSFYLHNTNENSSNEISFFLEKDTNRYPGLQNMIKNKKVVIGNLVLIDNNKQMIVFKRVE